jgi:hypothetical protein
VFRIQDLAKVFFDRSKDWIRWLHRDAPNYDEGHFVLDGDVLQPKRSRANYRVYSLADIERLALALHQDGRLSDEDLTEIIGVVIFVAVRYKILSLSQGQEVLAGFRASLSAPVAP